MALLVLEGSLLRFSEFEKKVLSSKTRPLGVDQAA